MDQNPYAVSTIQPSPTDFHANAHQNSLILGVDGDCLVVRNGAVLPPICIKSGQPVAPIEMRQKKIYWATPWIYILILLNVLAVLIAYFIVRKKCEVTFGVSNEVKKKNVRKILTKLFVTIGLFIAFFITLVAAPEQPYFLIPLIAFFISIIVLLVGNSLVYVGKHVDGAFWLKGISPDVLNLIANAIEQAPQPTAGASLAYDS